MEQSSSLLGCPLLQSFPNLGSTTSQSLSTSTVEGPPHSMHSAGSWGLARILTRRVRQQAQGSVCWPDKPHSQAARPPKQPLKLGKLGCDCAELRLER